MRSRGSIGVATFAIVCAAFCGVLHSAVAARTLAKSGTLKTFCSMPRIGPAEGEAGVDALLGLERRSVKAGGTLRIRIENFGTKDLAYNLAYQLARRKEGSWVKVRPKPVFGPRLYVPAGTASQCQSIDIPRHAIPGHYRIAKKVDPVDQGKLVIRATFRVLRSR